MQFLFVPSVQGQYLLSCVSKQHQIIVSKALVECWLYFLPCVSKQYQIIVSKALVECWLSLKYTTNERNLISAFYHSVLSETSFNNNSLLLVLVNLVSQFMHLLYLAVAYVEVITKSSPLKLKIPYCFVITLLSHETK